MKKINWNNLSKDEIIFLLETQDNKIIQELYKNAYQTKVENVGKFVYFRGIIELSNICEKNCFYCGIRKDNLNVNRYFMTDEDILEAAKFAYEMNYGSIVLQSGERKDKNFIDKIEYLLKEIMKLSNNELGITLSLGEQNYTTLQKWRKAGATRYLLRIETSKKELYKKLHPENHSFDERIACLKNLRKLDYQVGTGVLIGTPYQTTEDLADDIIFYKENDIDMIGMGPFIPHPDTPFGNVLKNYSETKQLELGLKMIALTRLFLKDVNIASTTALQTLGKDGRSLGLLAGANIIMPVITDSKYRKKYLLYQNKPSLDENKEDFRKRLEIKINSLGEKIFYGKKGDSPHYKKRRKL